MKFLKISSRLDVEFKIFILNDLLNKDNKSLIEFGESNRRLVFVDSKVFDFYGDDINSYFSYNEINAKIISIDISEDKKDLETLMFMLESIENFGLLRRSEPIITMGGGVLMDMVGFASNIFRRGIPYIKVPTTLLSLVDAAISVKTSINHFNRRNRLGSYYAPIAAYLDKSFLKTLPYHEIYSAMGEIVKMAVIKDDELFEMLDSNIVSIMEQKFLVDGIADEIIFNSIKDMVDELEPNLWEINLKRIVDFGHSFSPALEMKSLFDTEVDSLTHGQAVALDVIFSSCLSYYRNLLTEQDLDRIINVCIKCNLPVYHPYFEDYLLLWNSLLDTVKHRNGNQNLPIPTTIGQSIFLNDVTLNDVKESTNMFREKTL